MGNRLRSSEPFCRFSNPRMSVFSTFAKEPTPLSETKYLQPSRYVLRLAFFPSTNTGAESVLTSLYLSVCVCVFVFASASVPPPGNPER
jgi:hypothetical protein